jgi:hypothetical protein
MNYVVSGSIGRRFRQVMYDDRVMIMMYCIKYYCRAYVRVDPCEGKKSDKHALSHFKILIKPPMESRGICAFPNLQYYK